VGIFEAYGINRILENESLNTDEKKISTITKGKKDF
jgi:hypothetical protein